MIVASNDEIAAGDVNGGKGIDAEGSELYLAIEAENT
jgi:hypothetical protein